MIAQFQVGVTYYASSIVDHNSIHTLEVIARTAKTIRAIVDGRIEKTLRPSIYRDEEQVKPHGSHSMCTIIGANDTKVLKPDWEREAPAQ